MGASGGTGWNVLSGMIRRKVQDARDKHNAAEAQERQNEFDLIMEGVRAHAANGTLTDEMIQQAQDKMKKLTPKDAHPLVDAFHKVIGHVRDARKLKGQGVGQGQSGPATPAGIPAKPGTVQQPPSQAPAQTPPQTPPAAPQAAPDAGSVPTPAKPQVPPSMFPSAAQRGTAAGQEEVSATTERAKYADARMEGVIQTLKDKGMLTPEVEKQIRLQAAGIPGVKMPAAAATRFQRVVVRDPNDPKKRIPALQNMATGEVHGPDGNLIENPEIVTATSMKPRQGWEKRDGKIIGVMLDPITGQVIPGSENPNILPPAAYLDKFQNGYIGFTDEEGNFALVPKRTSTGPVVPNTVTSSGGTGTSAPAVPPALHPKTKAAVSKPGAGVARVGVPDSAGKHLPPGSIVIGKKPAGAQARSRADAARAIKPLIDHVEQLLQDPEVSGNLGPLSGRWDKLEQRAGNLSGKLRDLAGTLVSIYSLGGAMHGWRSASVAEKFASTYGDLTATPDSLLGGMKAMRGTADVVEKVAYPDSIAAPPPKSDADRAAEQWLQSH